MKNAKSCTGCQHHIGAGLCRLNLECECGEGGHEAWEPREVRSYTREEFADVAVSCGWCGVKAARAYVREHPKERYTSDDLMQLRRETSEGYLSCGKHRHALVTYGETTRTTKSFRVYNGHDV